MRLCEVAVGTEILASMFSTIFRAAPRIGVASTAGSDAAAGLQFVVQFGRRRCLRHEATTGAAGSAGATGAAAPLPFSELSAGAA